MTFDYSLDLPAIQAYNARRGADSPYRLQTEMGPELSAGDATKARLILLMNNPGSASSPAEHTLAFDGWPLAGLHPTAPQALRDWYMRPFGLLIRERGAQWVSQSVAIIQMSPWASEAFDSGLVLPSRTHQFELARAAARRGAVMVSGRSHQLWRTALDGFVVHQAINVRNPTITPAGLTPDGWAAVLEVVNG